MQAGCCKNGMIISKSPIIQLGLHGIINQQLPDYEMAYCRAPDELTLLQLRRTVLVVADLSGDVRQARTICQQYYSMIMQYHDIHWVFMVSRAFYPFAGLC